MKKKSKNPLSKTFSSLLLCKTAFLNSKSGVAQANTFSGTVEVDPLYSSAVTLDGDTVLNGTTVVFDGNATIDGAYNLSANISNNTTFNGTIGGSTPLSSINISSDEISINANVTTIGDQTYQSYSGGSGTIALNGSLTTSDSDFSLLGQGASGASLGLAGDTTIDVGTAEFSIQQGTGALSDGVIYNQGVNASYNLSITAGNITVTGGIGVAGSSNVASPQLGDFTINGVGQVGLNVSQVATTGNITSNPQIRIYQDTTMTSGAGSINLAQGVNNGSKALILGDSNQTGDIFIGGLQVRHLEVAEGAYDMELNGSMHIATNLSAPTEFKNTGNLTLYGQGSSFFGGIEAPNVSNTFVAGCVATFGNNINLANVTMVNGAPYANRFDTRWTQTVGATADGADITISNFTSSTSKPVEFDIGNGTPNTVNLTGATFSTNKLYFKGVGNANFNGDANLSDGVYAQNLSHEQNTTPDLNFNGNVTLIGAMEFEGISATFANGVEAAGNDLTLNFSQTTTLGGFNNVANFTSLGAVDLNGNFATTGSQNYSGNVALNADTNLIATSISLSEGLSGNANNLTLSPSSGSIELDGIELSGVNQLTVGGNLDLGGNLSASDIDIQGAISLLGDANLFASDIQIDGAIDGGYAFLTNGNTNFAAPIGGTDALVSLTTENGTVGLGGNVTTTGDQNYGGLVTLSDNVTFAGNTVVMLNGLEGSGYDVEFSANSTSLDAAVNNFSNIAALTVSNDASINGTIATSGNQSYGGEVELLGDTTLTAGAGTISLGTGGEVSGSTETLTLGDASQTGAVTLGGGSTVSLGGLNIGAGAFDVTIPTAYTVNVNNSVDFLNNGTLSITTGAGQSSYVKFRDGLSASAVSQLNFFGGIRTENAPIDLGDVVLNNDSGYSLPLGALFSAESGTEPGANITVKSLDTAGGVFGYTSGSTGTFVIFEDSNITGWGIQGTGDFQALGNIALGEANNLTSINTTGDQYYAENVTLLDNAAFVGDSATFANGVEAAGNDLSLNFSKKTTLEGFNNVADFTSEGAVSVNGTFATTGSQTYNSDVHLEADVSLQGTALNFSENVYGQNNNLTINATEGVQLDGALFSKVDQLTINSDATISGDLYASAIDLQGNLTLSGDTSLLAGQSSPNLTAVTGPDFSWQVAEPSNATNFAAADQKGRGAVVSSDGSQVLLLNEELGMTLWDISDPTSPQNITDTSNPILWDGANGTFTAEAWSTAYSPTSDTIYVVGEAGTAGIGFSAIDISDTANATVTDTINSTEFGGGSPYQVKVTPDGETAVLSLQGNGTTGGIALVDLTDPGNLSPITFNTYESGGSTIELNSTEGIALSADGDYAFVGSQYNKTLTIVDISDPQNASFVSSVETGTDIWTIEVSEDGQQVYVGGQSGLSAIDISDVETPQVLTNVATFNDGNGSQPLKTFGIGLSEDGTTLFASSAGSYSDLTTSVVAYDITDPTSLAFGGFLSQPAVSLTNGGFFNRVTTTPDGRTLIASSFGFSGDNTGAVFNFYEVPYDPIASGTINFNGTIDGAAAFELDSTAGDINFMHAVGDTTPLDSLTITGGGNSSFAANVTTTGDQDYSSLVILNGDVTFAGDGVTFGGIDGGGNNLSINATSTTLDAATNSFSNVAALNVSGAASLNGTIATSGDLFIGGKVSLLGTTALSSGAGEINISTSGAVGTGIYGSGKSLTLGDANQTGSITLGAVQASTLAIGAGKFDIALNGGQVPSLVSTGLVEFNNSGNVTLSSVSQSFFGGVDTSGVANTYIAGCLATFGTDITLENVTLLDNANPAGGWSHRFDTRWTQVTGAAADGGNISISNLTATTNLAPKVEFDIGIGAPNTITLSGTTTSTNPLYFKGVGQVNFLGDANLAGGIFAQNLVFTGGVQENTTPDLNFNGNVTLTGAMEFEGRSATFANEVEAAGNDLTLNFSETTTLDGFNNVANFTSQGAVDLNGTFATTGSQTYNGNVALLGDATLTGTTASFTSAVEGSSNNLTLNMSGLTSLTGGLNNVTDFSASGDLELGGNFSTSGAQTFGGNVSLAGDTSMSGINATFSAITGNDNNLSLNYSGGAIALGETYSGIVDFTADSAVTLSGNFSTSGSQTYNANASLTSDTALSGTTASFASGLDGGGNDLTLNFSQTSTLDSLNNVGNLTSEGAVNLNGTFTTSGSQTYNSNVGLSGDSSLTGTTASFNGAVDGGGNNLTLNMSGLTSLTGGLNNVTDFSASGDVELGGNFSTGGTQTFGGNVALAGDTSMSGINATFSAITGNDNNLSLNYSGGAIALGETYSGIADFTAESAVTLSGNFSTSGSQTYNANASLTGDASLSGTSASFASGLDGGGNNLSLNFSQTSSLDGVSNVADLSSEGAVNLNGTIATSGSQTYNGTVDLSGDSTLSGTTASFSGAVDGGGNNLSLNMSGLSSLTGGVSNIADFSSTGDVALAGNLSTTGSQTYGGDLSLAGDTTLSGTTASLNGVTGNSNNLTVNFSGGAVSLAGQYTGIADFIAESDVDLDGALTTSGSQTYKADATLAGDTTLTGTSASFSESLAGGGNNLSLNMSGLTTLSKGTSGLSTFSSTGDVAFSGTFATSGNQTFGGNVTLLADSIMSGASASFANGLDGSGHNLSVGFTGTIDTTDFVNLASLEKTGNGTLILSGNNSNSGGIVVAGGTVEGTTNSLTGDITNEGTLRFNQGFDGSYSDVVSGNGSLEKSGDGIVTLSGTNTYTGGTTVNNGTLAGTTDSLQGAITNNGAVRFDQSTNGTHNNVISGTGSLEKNGSGVVTLSGTNTYSGGTTVNGGTLAGTTDSLQGAISNNGTVQFDQSSDGTYSGDLSGSGSLEKNSNGTLTLSGTNTYSGGTTVNNGTLAGTTDSLQGAISNNGTVRFDQSSNGTYSGAMDGSGLLEKSGNGTVTLSGTNSYTGGTTVNNGTLAGTTDSLQGAISNNGTVRFDQSANGTYAGVLSGSGSLEKSGTGTVTLSATNTYSGGTTVNAGTLIGTTVSLQGAISNNGTVHIDQSANGTYSGAMSGTGSFEKSGTGTVTLSGTNDYSGATSVNGGTLELSSSLANSAVTINSGGTLKGATSIDSLTINNGGRLSTNLSGGSFITGNTVFNGGGIFEWSVNNVSGTQGNNWVYLDSTGSLNLTASSTDTFVVEASTLSGSGFDPEAKKYIWEFASFDGGINNFSRDAFSVDSSGMTGADGRFFVTSENDALFLNYKTAAVWNSGNGNWSTLGQWEDASGPENTDNIEFVGAGGISTNDNYITTIDGLLFTSDVSGAYTLDGSAMSITLEGIINESSEQHTIAMDLELPSDQVMNTANGSLDVTGVISGAGGLIKQGSETLTLSGINTYTGGTTVSAGSLIGTTDSLQGAITNNGAVQFDQSSNGTYASVMSGSGSLAKSGSGKLLLSGANTHTGGTTLNAGGIEVASGSALGNGAVTLNGGELLIRSQGEMQANLGFGGDLNWNGGTIAFYDTGLSPDSNDLQINVGGNFLNGGNGGVFDFSQVEALDAGTYTLVAYSGTTDFQNANFSSAAGVGTTLNGTFSLENDEVRFTVAGATSSGTDIQNNGGPNTPVVSDYTIDQEIITVNENNIVNSLTFVDDGNLTIETDGKLEITSGKITVSNDSNSTISEGEIIVNNNDLVKDGDGHLKIENIILVENNNTLIEEGLLSINGNLKTNNLIVQTGGTLGGDGTVEADVQVAGTLAAGNSPGTLNITGDLILDPGSTTEIEIESLTNYDQIIATGDIVLDGTLTASIWGSGSIAVGDKYDVFQTTGVGTSITGEFDTYNAPTNYRIRLLNTGTIASLRFAPITYTLMAQTQNQFNVAAALDSFIPATAGDTMTVSVALDELTEAEYPAAFEQVMPYFYESFSEILLDQSFHQTEHMQQRLGLLRTMHTDSETAPEKLGWNAWTQLHLDSMRSSAFDAAPAYENERDGFRVGADYYGDTAVRFGVFAGRDFNEVDYAPGSSLNSDSIQLGAYGSFQDDSGIYLDAILSAGTVDIETRRAIAFSTIDRNASAETESLQFNAAVSLGQDYQHGNFTFGPYAGLEMSHLKIDSFAESGADSLNLGLGDQTVKRLSSEIGGHLSYRMEVNEQLTLVPELRVSLHTNLTDRGRTLEASLEGGSGAAFDYVPADRDRDGIATSLGVSALHGDDWAASVHWNTHTESRDGKSNAISLSLNHKF